MLQLIPIWPEWHLHGEKIATSKVLCQSSFETTGWQANNQRHELRLPQVHRNI